MKVLIVATSYKPKNYIEELTAGQRYRVEYLALSEQLPADYMDYDAPWMHGRDQVRKLEERIHVDFYWAWEIARKVREEKFDVVLSMSERVAVPLGMMLEPHVKHVAILLNAMAPKWLSAIKLLSLQRRWTHIITYSQAEADALMTELSIGPEKISSCLNGVDLDFFQPSGMVLNSDEAPFIMSQGLSKRDYPTLIRALQKLPHVTCQISAVSAWDKFKAGYEGMDIPSNVQLKSFNHPSLIKTVTEQCRFVVLPLDPNTGMWCAGSTTVLQAQAMGKPVIVTHLPGIAEYIRDGETGLLVKGNDPDAMASAIDQLWQDPERAAQMGRNAQKWVRENFSLQHYVDHISALLKRAGETKKVYDGNSNVNIKTNPRMIEIEGKEKVHM